MEISLGQESKEEVSKMLNTILSDEFVLYTKIRNFHWNVQGAHFYQYHKFFEELYSQVEGNIDDTAERIKTLGQRPFGSLKEFLDNTTLNENTNQLTDKEMLKDLENDYHLMIKNISNCIEKSSSLNDVGTEDYLTGLLQEYEKNQWMLHSMIQ